MKLFQKKKNNKGFSLVELIVVVAIMAVLMAVLVPTLIKKVESSRKQKDLSALSEIREAMILELAYEEYCQISGSLSATGTVAVTKLSGSVKDPAGTDKTAAFLAAVAEDVDDVEMKSAYSTLEVKFSISEQKVVCTVGGYDITVTSEVEALNASL